MAKLNIAPMKVGFEPIAAYDKVENKVYIGIKVDKKGSLENLRFSISKAFGFAVNLAYAAPETIKYLLAKASLQEKALSNKLNTQNQPQGG